MSSPANQGRRRRTAGDSKKTSPSPGKSPRESPRKEMPGHTTGVSGDVNIQVPLERASMAVARKNKYKFSCSKYEPETDTYTMRPILKTTREELGEYGLGIQVYFELLVGLGLVLLVMGILSLPLLVFNYLGDFGGLPATFFAKLTIGNIGICGSYGELCPDLQSYPYRLLMDSSSTLVREVTPVFGALSTIGIALFAAFVVYFYYFYLKRARREHKSHQLSVTDYAIEVDYLPAKLETEEKHATYEGLLVAHFNKVAGSEGAVVEVALARDYHGGIRTYLELHDLGIQIKEARAQLKRSASKKEEAGWSKRIKKLSRKQSEKEHEVLLQGYTHEYDRPVCRAFLIFSQIYYQKRVLEAYSWTTKGSLLRHLQGKPLRFAGKAIRVRRTTEPGNIYHENLDVSRWEARWRTLFTVVAAIIILVGSAGLLLLFQTATRTGDPVALGSKPVWIIANATPATDTCLETCSVKFFADVECSLPVTGRVVGTLESSGVFSFASSEQSDVCTVGNVWTSDRCVNVLARNPIVPTSVIENPTVFMEIPPSPTNPWVSSNVSLLPNSSAVCAAGSTLCGLSICYTAAQKCDGIWNCPNGEDEFFCSYLCPASSPLACPINGLCISAFAGSCGSACLGVNLTSSPTCSTIYNRTVNAELQDCDVSNLLATTFNGLCTGGFLQSPCCVLDQLADSDVQFLSKCSASYSVDDTAHITSQGLSMLGYMQAYCAGETRAANSLNNFCLDSDVKQLYTFSQNCFAAMRYNTRWCECLQDTVLMPLATINRLDQCEIASSDFSFFGSQTGFNRLSSLMDVIRGSCQGNDDVPPKSTTTAVSPLVSLGFQMGANSSSAEAILSNISSTISALPGLAASLSVSAAVDNQTANVRIDIFDRSDSSNATVWNLNVASTYQLVSSAFQSFNPRILSLYESHCPATSMFQCSMTRSCLSLSQVCDGIPDCEAPLPSQDESADICDKSSVAGECSEDELRCASGDECITNLFWCDGVQDCGDNSDETDAECLIQKDVRTSTNATSSFPSVYDQPEFRAFIFSEPVSVQCISMTQPLNSLSSLLKVYACEESVVFRPGKGAVLRYPDLNCIKVQSRAIRSGESAESLTSPQNAVITPSNVQYDVFQPLPINCSSTSDDDPCPLLTGQSYAFCNVEEGACKLPIPYSRAQMTVVTQPSCDFGSPISPTVGLAALQKYSNSDGMVGVNKSIFQDLTYTCFCDQQAEYNFATNPLFLFPPYTTAVQLICEPYYTKLYQDQLLAIGAILVVAVLNFFLRLVMYWLSDFERKYSLTGKAASEMWKLFLAQFINTAILVLIVNAKFYGVTWSFAGLGAGQYPDTTETWFLKIGAGLSITMLILIGSLLIPTILIEIVFRWYARRSARKKLTQEAMNKCLEPSDFLLSMRLAQTTNMIVVTVLYFSSIPLMVWIGALYCFLSYWCDKFYLLRYSKVPPQYSEQTVKICLRLLPIAVIGNCMLMVWTMSNQEVFPSDLISESFSHQWEGYFDEDAILLYISGSAQFNNSAASYQDYLVSRFFDSLRQAPIGGYVVLALVVLYFLILILSSLISLIVGPIIQLATFRMTQNRRETLRSNTIRQEEEKPSFDKVKKQLESHKILSSYRMKAHPKYVDAYGAINKVRKKAAFKSEEARKARLALATSHPSEPKSPVSESPPSSGRRAEYPSLHSSPVKVIEPQDRNTPSPSSALNTDQLHTIVRLDGSPQARAQGLPRPDSPTGDPISFDTGLHRTEEVVVPSRRTHRASEPTLRTQPLLPPSSGVLKPPIFKKD